MTRIDIFLVSWITWNNLFIIPNVCPCLIFKISIALANKLVDLVTSIFIVCFPFYLYYKFFVWVWLFIFSPGVLKEKDRSLSRFTLVTFASSDVGDSAEQDGRWNVTWTSEDEATSSLKRRTIVVPCHMNIEVNEYVLHLKSYSEHVLGLIVFILLWLLEQLVKIGEVFFI